MNDNLKEIIEKLVYKTTEENGWAPQNKLGQHLARMGRSVRELGYEKMSNFFQDHPERFQVEKDEHGLPVVQLIGEPPVGADDFEHENAYSAAAAAYPRHNNYRTAGYRQPNDYGRQQPYGGNGYGRFNSNFNSYGYGRPMNPFRQRMPQFGYRQPNEQMSLFRWAFFPDREEWLQMLADLAKEQVWQYEGHDPQHPNPALFDYLRDTFRRLQIEGRVLESRAEGIALFNTGLLDREEGRPIYAVFGPNPNRNRQPWLFQEFFLSSAPLLAAARAEAAKQQNSEPYDEIDEDDDYNMAPLNPGEEPAYYSE